MKTLPTLFNLYRQSHRHPINLIIHTIAVPAIYLSILGMLWCIPTQFFINWSIILFLPVLVHYFRLSRPLALGVLVLTSICFVIFWVATNWSFPLLKVCCIIFITSWIFQFIGHHVEGKRPAFADDVQFLLIGPLWVLAKIYTKLGIKFSAEPKKT